MLIPCSDVLMINKLLVDIEDVGYIWNIHYWNLEVQKQTKNLQTPPVAPKFHFGDKDPLDYITEIVDLMALRCNLDSEKMKNSIINKTIQYNKYHNIDNSTIDNMHINRNNNDNIDDDLHDNLMEIEFDENNDNDNFTELPTKQDFLNTIFYAYNHFENLVKNTKNGQAAMFAQSIFDNIHDKTDQDNRDVFGTANINDTSICPYTGNSVIGIQSNKNKGRGTSKRFRGSNEGTGKRSQANRDKTLRAHQNEI